MKGIVKLNKESRDLNLHMASQILAPALSTRIKRYFSGANSMHYEKMCGVCIHERDGNKFASTYLND